MLDQEIEILIRIYTYKGSHEDIFWIINVLRKEVNVSRTMEILFLLRLVIVHKFTIFKTLSKNLKLINA